MLEAVADDPQAPILVEDTIAIRGSVYWRCKACGKRNRSMSQHATWKVYCSEPSCRLGYALPIYAPLEQLEHGRRFHPALQRALSQQHRTR